MSTYRIKSNLSEKQLEADIASYFGWISQSAPIRLLDIDESTTGADKKYFDGGYAFFMQFKVSKGLEPISKIPSSNRKNRSKLEDIREFRADQGLEDDPTLYFGLRKMAKNAGDYQHNMLLKYANTQFSQAFYVAPLHTNKTTYYNCLFDSVNRFRRHPFSFYRRRLFQKEWVSYISHIPFLKEHVSIIPHETVSTHEHHYSYSMTGSDIAWHSTETLSESPSRLSDTLFREITKCIEKRSFLEISDLESRLELHPSDADVDGIHPIERIQERTRHLYKQFGIRLILLLVNRRYMS